MRLGNITMLREALAGRDSEGALIIGETYACALKKAAGFSGTRWFDIDACIAWLKLNPKFRTRDVYPRRSEPNSVSAVT